MSPDIEEKQKTATSQKEAKKKTMEAKSLPCHHGSGEP